MGEVDPAFIQEPEHRPKPSVIQAEGIPLIDLSPLYTHVSGDSDSVSDPISLQGLVKEIGSACKQWGFFQVINHGVPLDKRQRIEDAARKFFAQSLEEKRKIRRDAVKVLGYYDTEHTKNVRDWKEVFDFCGQEPILVPALLEADDKEVTEWYNQWPEYPPDLR
ncbi:2-oxoglutarate and Fe(II)-dependent oxygenase superfamily protein [Quillaja saponaria]|uniref:2-oxoglutarate and Fe(II)-dependent oxygenase superfamily protein n=1 Tax=Quillaja saponaria TaxID=32244 RepID=A0AAD7M0H1_QUISA|nr:2-oxoglutarate and Fe(II)-dependent oxygenase superfamily protein [Quillaja saponaria]